MFRWYAEAQLCYVFLSDVPNESARWDEQFEQSLWFTRAWILQELLAPCAVEFYAADWYPIGTRRSRSKELSVITAIAPTALTRSWSRIKDTVLAAQNLSWATHRQASRGEDSAYSLLGLFDLNMPMLCGEEEQKAFVRLQKAVYKKDADHSLFLFWPRLGLDTVPLFSESTSEYCQQLNCGLCTAGGRGQGVYHDVPYSALNITRNLHGTIESDHFIRIVRDGIMLKLPIIRSHEIPPQYSFNMIFDESAYQTMRLRIDTVFAMLNVSCHG